MGKTNSRRLFSSYLFPVGLAAAGLALALLVFSSTRLPESPAPKASTSGETTPPRSARSLPPVEQTRSVASAGKPGRADFPGSWEERLDEILTGEGSNSETVRHLLQNFNRWPAEAQSEFIAHALNLCEDENYDSLNAIYLRSDTPVEVLEQIFDDSLNRPDEIKLPMMARTMTAPNHPMREPAGEILSLYLDLEPDTELPINWDERVRAYLQTVTVEE
jgi:hypothetical protein